MILIRPALGALSQQQDWAIEPLINKRKPPRKRGLLSPDTAGVNPAWLVITMRGLGYTIGYGVIFFLVMFMMARNGWSAYVDGIKPFILILPVYFFAVYRATFFPPVLLVCIGLTMDLFIGVPFGLSPIIALFLQYAVSRQAKFIREFPSVMIMVLAVVPITIAEVMRWLAMSLLSAELQPLYPALMAAIWAFVIYIPLSLVFHKVLRLVSVS